LIKSAFLALGIDKILFFQQSARSTPICGLLLRELYEIYSRQNVVTSQYEVKLPVVTTLSLALSDCTVERPGKFSRSADHSHLVGETLGMVMHGFETTVPVTLGMMILQGPAFV
jgi:hypothetical protein